MDRYMDRYCVLKTLLVKAIQLMQMVIMVNQLHIRIFDMIARTSY